MAQGECMIWWRFPHIEASTSSVLRMPNHNGFPSDPGIPHPRPVTIEVLEDSLSSIPVVFLRSSHPSQNLCQALLSLIANIKEGQIPRLRLVKENTETTETCLVGLLQLW